MYLSYHCSYIRDVCMYMSIQTMKFYLVIVCTSSKNSIVIFYIQISKPKPFIHTL
jgi:hypothetical protein